MKHLVKLLAIVCLFCVALVAKAQLNGTYWAPDGKCLKFYENGRYEYLSIITEEHNVVLWADTLTCGDYQVLGKGGVIKLDSNPRKGEIWRNNTEVVYQISPKVGRDSVAIVFAFPFLDNMPLELRIEENDAYSDFPAGVDTTIMYDRYRNNTVVLPMRSAEMLLSYDLTPFNIPSMLMRDENVSSEYYLRHKNILLKKPNNRVIIRNEKNKQAIFDNVLHNGDYCLLSGDTIIFKNMNFVKRERKMVVPRGDISHRCYQ